jgi:hypothetical protein
MTDALACLDDEATPAKAEFVAAANAKLPNELKRVLLQFPIKDVANYRDPSVLNTLRVFKAIGDGWNYSQREGVI